MSKKKKRGRPTTVTNKEVAKLEYAFSIGAKVKVARNYANISKDAYYRFLKKNPEFRERFDDLRTTQILKSLETVNKNLKDPEMAKWVLERRSKDEYSTRQEIDGEVRFSLWQKFIKKAHEDAPRYLGHSRGNAKKAA
jgi:hypothetical protein